MPNFMLIAITRGNFRCVGQFATGPAVPSPWYGYMAKEEVRRHPEAQNAGITGVGWSTGSFGIPSSGSVGMWSPAPHTSPTLSKCRLTA